MFGSMRTGSVEGLVWVWEVLLDLESWCGCVISGVPSLQNLQQFEHKPVDGITIMV